MTTISAKIILDTMFPRRGAGTRITTMQLRYPRILHAEELTHRLLRTTPESVETLYIPDGLMYDENLSRNASSARAVPATKLVEDVRRDPFIPIYWGKNQPGMQARQELEGEALVAAKEIWNNALESALLQAEMIASVGAHKQLVNRILEPYVHINVVVTATEWDNFFALRDHEDAEPHIQLLAQRMKEAMAESTPGESETHLPYIQEQDVYDHPGEMQSIVKVSAARCARVSYMTHDNKKPDWDADLELASKLSGEPPHLSPFEHQARWIGGSNHFGQPMKYANFRDWRSQRYCMERGWDF